MILNLSVLQLFFLPPVLLLVSGLALFNFQNVFRFLTMNLKSYMTIPAVQAFKPYADKLRYGLEQVLGKASSFKFNVSHVLMMAVVIVLIAIYDAIQRNNQLQEQQLKLRQKSKRA
ncbi:uncharacterized protein PITG_08745 [Phytophthora infestans T30-4]|uniref:Uncharacterized protein n=2 Tax=Phytophthora infestans TaxID=4787 RepID=D0ND39_PHYIT|nr:uncharacterized protein PITG_08745 [Phytophthora infestans T30-4]EEY55996.1 conserved hypothetical protein [Phytophthora infestans T30-4]KAF4032400.1 hypothetical protein GN244_ATG15713 [Phytophthora infestans]KAF4149548.1 hypothetical protein GN958_ATG01265 [Phytophthora infestans]KAI9981706.1 hypothetical protein PInf_009463 [Phytophthora infestans]|eukprot:XP_002902826.1 conserved hypothetical protein [Phytophthora infestans T30-4]